MLRVECLEVGLLKCNCYKIEKDGKCLLVDPGDDKERIITFIGSSEVLAILVTHSHFDHVGCVDSLSKKYDRPVYKFDNVVEGEIQIGDFKFEVIRVPGHSKDSISFYFRDDGVMFTGDFLFYDTVGRCDLEGGNFGEMVESIEKIKKYADQIVIYPGHGRTTVLGLEKKNNLYF